MANVALDVDWDRLWRSPYCSPHGLPGQVGNNHRHSPGLNHLLAVRMKIST